MRINDLAIPGAVGRPAQPSTLWGRSEGEILVSMVWEVWCTAIWRVRYRARGNWDCESVKDAILCVQQERHGGVEREREYKMREAKDPSLSRA